MFVVLFAVSAFSQPLYDSLKADFSNLPLAKRLTGPLFWQHGCLWIPRKRSSILRPAAVSKAKDSSIAPSRAHSIYRLLSSERNITPDPPQHPYCRIGYLFCIFGDGKAHAIVVSYVQP